MQTYDQIEGFEYWNIDAWRKFIKESIIPLHTATSKLIKLRDYILSIIGTDGKTTLSEVEKRRRDLIPFFLGGVGEDGEYKENSLAKLIKLTLGIYVNPKEWIILEREEGLRASDYITVKSESTPFLEFLRKIHEITLRIIKLIKEEPKKVLEGELEDIIQNPEKLLEIIKTIYVKCLQVSVNHNYYTFFALSTRILPFKYMVMAYPRLRINFESLKEFLGLEKIFEPGISETKVREDYTVWSHLKGGLCNSLYNLNSIIWKNFSNEHVKSVFNYISTYLKDLKQEYAEKVKQKLEEIKWEFPGYIKTSDRRYYSGATRGVSCYSYAISGAMLVKEREAGYTWGGTYYFLERECSISLFKLLDDLSPALFLSSNLFELKISGNTLEIVR